MLLAVPSSSLERPVILDKTDNQQYNQPGAPFFRKLFGAQAHTATSRLTPTDSAFLLRTA